MERNLASVQTFITIHNSFRNTKLQNYNVRRILELQI